MSTDSYLTRGGVAVRRTLDDIPVRNAIEPIVSALDEVSAPERSYPDHGWNQR